MEKGKIVYKDSDKGLTIRYPVSTDAKNMCAYINALSQEKTFIRFQGETIHLEEEKKYLRHQLELISKNKGIHLLALAQDQLIGTGAITLADRTERHTGLLGMSVAKEFRSKGIGSLLMHHLIEEAIRRLSDLEIITLSLFSTNNIGRSLYEKFGFKEYGSLPNGIKLQNSYDNHIMMYKVIKR